MEPVRFQKTIGSEVSYRGIGLHRGAEVSLTFKPAPADTGVVFILLDGDKKFEIKACVENVTNVKRGTTIGRDGVEVHTVEHVLSALAGLEIDNIYVELDAPEPPAGDGSSLPFVEILDQAGIVALSQKKKIFRIISPLTVSDYNDREKYWRHVIVLPSDEFRVSFTIEYEHPAIGTQFAEFPINEQTFRNEIMGSRTFGFLSEVKELQAQGLALGGCMDNAIVLSDDKIMNDHLNHEDEFVRHKILDVMGDLSLLEASFCAHVIGIKSGHALNIALIKLIKDKYLRKPPPQKSLSEGREIVYDVEDIMKILPHRYPFLLVDRIIELEVGKRAVGIKNVTINENFFSGHFPSKPVMPGVLIVEALAQVAGVFMLSQEDCGGKLPFFMGIDKVKFRRPVLPGDQLRLEVEVLRLRARTGKASAKAYVGDKVVCEGILKFTLVDG
ncbi:MAG: UDP-3-O-acyl-N-acetylglucosamine deacetylase [bacterium]|nr:UDP-3-O-acyl-N-acetylglucosamine deacetylase [bacterium]